MVIPERETPGNSASAWADPITMRVPQVGKFQNAPEPAGRLRHHHQHGHADHRRGNGSRIAPGLLDKALEERPYNGPGNRSDHQQPEKPAIRLNLLSAGCRRVMDPKAVQHQRDPGAQKIEHHGQQGPCVQGHVEWQAAVGPMQRPGKEPQMGAAADGKKFSEALNDSQHHRMK